MIFENVGSAIFSEANLSQQNFLLVKQYEPYGVYFEKLGKLLKNNIPIGTMFMPEYLGFLLIYLYKLEAQQSFCKFPFVNTLELEDIMNIYSEVNIKVKKELAERFPETKIWEHRTIFDGMEKIASKIIKEYDQFQYKLNVNRVSKTSKKSNIGHLYMKVQNAIVKWLKEGCQIRNIKTSMKVTSSMDVQIIQNANKNYLFQNKIN